MPNILFLPPEILHLIFHALQCITRGPRYVLEQPHSGMKFFTNLGPPKDEAEDLARKAEIAIIDASLPGSEFHARWVLSDAGPLHLAATCKRLREIYFSPYIAANLTLQISQPKGNIKAEADEYYNFWAARGRNGSLLSQLRRLKIACKGKPLTRFEFDWRWQFDRYSIFTQSNEMWSEILREVSDVFGDELMIVICSRGEDVQKDFRNLAPRRIKELETPDKTFRRPISNTDSNSSTGLEGELPENNDLANIRPRARTLRHFEEPLYPQYPAPEAPESSDLSASRPLALHVYCGYNEHRADIMMGWALQMFAGKHLQSLYFCSDPNNFHLVGHSRRPAEGHELYRIKNPFFPGNPWGHLLPSLTEAYKTLESITLDCSLFWSELAYALPHLYKLKHLDCELALLHTEPMYPMQLETKSSAGERILKTCALRDPEAENQKKMKKNKDKVWLDIPKENIVLPAIEPEIRTMATDPHSRFSTVEMKVCLQVGRRRITKSRRDLKSG